jgi:hypothetical protein
MLERHFLKEPRGLSLSTRWYWVRDHGSALVLMTEEGPAGFRSRDWLSAHRSGGEEECRFLPCGRCSMSHWGLHELTHVGAGPLADHGLPGSDLQPEEFWKWMEATFESHVLRRAL